MKKVIGILLAVVMVLSIAGCQKNQITTESENLKENVLVSESVEEKNMESRIIVDSASREVEVPNTVEKIVCVGVGALRYTSYMEAADLVVGIEDYEAKESISRLYNFVNFQKFKDLHIIGTNGQPNIEEIITVNPQVIVMTSFASVDPDELQGKTGIPVVVIPGSDTTLDDKAFKTIEILGELYNKKERAEDLTSYLNGIKKDLNDRTESIKDEDKPRVYVGGVSFKGHHGVEGTESKYGPFVLIGAKNLADEIGKDGAFDVDKEQILSWDPHLIFLDFNGMPIINEDYANNPEFYNNLTAVKENNVFSQISFRSSASNLETALADSYYAGKVMFPNEFEDLDIVEKTGEIFIKLLGENPYEQLKEAGFEFGKIEIGK